MFYGKHIEKCSRELVVFPVHYVCTATAKSCSNDTLVWLISKANGKSITCAFVLDRSKCQCCSGGDGR